jgi:hypothetical protein
VVNPKGKRPLGRPLHRWVVIIKKYIGEIGWDSVERTDIAQDRDHWRALLNMVLNRRVP